MHILAFDPSTTHTGWAGSTQGPIESGVFTPNKKAQWFVRVQQTRVWLDECLSVIRPDIIAYEIPTGNRGNMATNRKLGACEYAVLITAWEYGIRVIGVTASQTQNSGFGKKHIATTARLIGHTPTPDEADAVATLVCAYKILERDDGADTSKP